ncbi:GtrA family protein [Corynebacterium minutissimum]|uniref:GtrA family protein n=1 Tax=Corynebacterium minutissimum TaxID=38301 RepID=A0A2X4RGQ7_9CORY|nr:GtrA family protein [Corynebacterium minutissimum]KHO30518.1 membrane protein [Corynebacterium minutissimum]MCG7228483.1 GtrA family protein [Corynebacterium minutissimum]MCG7237600.1 GtrA family protein [Corynebacterium minutissimum]QPS60079.1 GtrA family protein [Corynebacterium minutissimum]QQA79131.1 GtrA family protein [Corynebacterium minutissimum]
MPTRAERLSQSNSLHAQGAKFAITGAIAAVIDVSITWLFQIGLDLFGDVTSRTLGFAAGTLVAYVLNRRWTFNANASKRRFAAVIATYAMTYAINILLYRWAFPFFDHNLEWPSSWALAVAFVIAQGTATIINFLVQRWVIFRSTRKSFEVE